MRTRKRLREVRGAKFTMLDATWAKRNGRSVTEMQQLYQQLINDFGETAYPNIAAQALTAIDALPQ